MNNKNIAEMIEGSSCTVIGYGVSNKPLVTWLISHGAASVTVRDKRTDRELQESGDMDLLSALGVDHICGENYLKNIAGDIIFRSPGIRPDLPEIVEVLDKGAILSSEMELFFEVCPCKIIAVTGSDGKTTTTTVTSLILGNEMKKTGGSVYLGGNIGTPLLDQAEKMTKSDVAVVELSSFQLMTMKRSPHIAVITNITPNHLNWHVDMDEYITAKCNVCTHEPIGRLIVNAENSVTYEIARNTDVPVTYFSSKRNTYDAIVPEYKRGCGTKAVYQRYGMVYISDGISETALLASDRIKLPGRHNVENYMAAIAATDGLVSRESIDCVASSFGGVPHRLELVGEIHGVKYYNSSIDSSPTRTIAALSAMDKPIIICGGQDKHVPFDPLATELCKKTKAVVLTGEARGQIMDALEREPLYSRDTLPVYIEPDFKTAVLLASSLAEHGDTVLLSPACTSFDAFKNFAERGEFFRNIINSLK